MKAINLRTEYMCDPIGIDVSAPRLFWNCEGDIKQTAYRISAKDDTGMSIYDSGKVESSKMAGILFEAPLESRSKIIWSVMLWNEKDECGEWSEPASFEMGFLGDDGFRAKWISGNYKVNRTLRYPPDFFKKNITLKRSIKRARLYATAMGTYTFDINGTRVSMPLAPGVTDYKKRVQYQTYDVTDKLTVGENSLEACLADGWYRGSVGAWGIRNQYGTVTKLIAEIEVIYDDGERESFGTDSTWSWTNDSEISFADNKDGEIINALHAERVYKANAKEVKCSVKPTASNNVPIAEKESFIPTMTVTKSGKKLLDFGQNFAGYLSFKLNSEGGKKMTITCGEMLDDDGELTLKNIQCRTKKRATPLQKIEYTCREGLNEYKTRFAIFGFRYAEVDCEFEISPENFLGIAVYSDFEETGYFDSSNELLNKFVDITKWSTKSNSTDLPTDCPTRERHGWTGDAQVFFGTAAYLFGYAPFAKKYLTDVFDWQRKDGCLPQIVPYGGVDFYMYTLNGSVGWSDAGILIPYRFSRHYNDNAILEKYYDRMCKYAEFMIKRMGRFTLLAKPILLTKANKNGLVNCGQSYGEWAEPKDVYPNDWTDMVLPHPEVSTAYTAYVLGVMAEISEALGKENDRERFEKHSRLAASSYRELVTKDGFSLDTDRQACLVRPLYMKLLSEDQESFAKKRLVKALDNYGWRLGTGFLSTPLILDVLAEIDIAHAYKLLLNEEMPGWLFMPKMGATTVWESWEGTAAQGGIASLNHYSKGAVCEWLFRGMCGIIPKDENEFVLKPMPHESLKYASAKYMSIYGEIESSWSYDGEKFTYEFLVPANCTAHVILPDGREELLTCGRHVL